MPKTNVFHVYMLTELFVRLFRLQIKIISFSKEKSNSDVLLETTRLQEQVKKDVHRKNQMKKTFFQAQKIPETFSKVVENINGNKLEYKHCTLEAVEGGNEKILANVQIATKLLERVSDVYFIRIFFLVFLKMM